MGGVPGLVQGARPALALTRRWASRAGSPRRSTAATWRCSRAWRGEGRLHFMGDRDEPLAGIAGHLSAGGHTFGIQWFTVPRRNGAYVVASDTAMWYSNIEEMWPSGYTNGGTYQMLMTYGELQERVGDELERVVPGHDMKVFEKPSELTRRPQRRRRGAHRVMGRAPARPPSDARRPTLNGAHADPRRDVAHRGRGPAGRRATRVLVVEGDTIRGGRHGPPPSGRRDEVIDAAGMLVTPGFVNAHTHLCMIYGRDLGTDRSLLHWLSEAQVPLMGAFEPEDYEMSMQLGAIENLLAGNTTVCEVFFSPHYDQEVDHCRARRSTARGSARCSSAAPTTSRSSTASSRPGRRSSSARERLIAEFGRRRIARRSASARWCPGGRAPTSFRDAVELAAARRRIHLHTAETPEYNDLVRERDGQEQRRHARRRRRARRRGDAQPLRAPLRGGHRADRRERHARDPRPDQQHDPRLGVSPVPRCARPGSTSGSPATVPRATTPRT